MSLLNWLRNEQITSGSGLVQQVQPKYSDFFEWDIHKWHNTVALF